ncbi:hypothetical protein PY092_14390 [Muricauda sp. 334s03]|uniref:Uncharacterized protein n=1 Tax=Flagellimonas yonaguniensis TaxID=3031325 RepID=A0ABT5Y1L8_9FLAO|nr:hypothetical protein [[Muricauda] yonaguniensis]MDF0717349.1 hypothetical protein [[Muricauda] yonaguniensis]
MKLYDICILKTGFKLYSEGTYVILIDDGLKPIYMAEFWNFEEFNGAQIDAVDEEYLRLAMDVEIKEYQVRFKEYCDRNNNA